MYEERLFAVGNLDVGLGDAGLEPEDGIGVEPELFQYPIYLKILEVRAVSDVFKRIDTRVATACKWSRERVDRLRRHTLSSSFASESRTSKTSRMAPGAASVPAIT
jgi:hypothetical protein